MGAVKNMIKGFIFTGIYVTFTIVLPLVFFTLIFSIENLPLEWEQQDQNNIKFWLVAFGLLVSGLAFFKYSSPKQSIRKAIFALIQVIVNCLYIWSYRFSGATEITFVIYDTGFFTLDLSQMILIYMGIYFLTIILKVYDVIDFTINREKIRENRMK
ncbi:MAG: hypothetical protein ACFE8B_07295 [Candidatus Hermodarchaeota archaeon]